MPLLSLPVPFLWIPVECLHSCRNSVGHHKVLHVNHHCHCQPPVLTAGNISPAVMMDFENAAQDFFVAKSVPADKQVKMVIPGLKDIPVRDWITADHDQVVALPFADFMKELRVNFLHQDWKDPVCNNILTSTLATSNMTFWNGEKLNTHRRANRATCAC
jgi:hypothetical protein